MGGAGGIWPEKPTLGIPRSPLFCLGTRVLEADLPCVRAMKQKHRGPYRVGMSEREAPGRTATSTVETGKDH